MPTSDRLSALGYAVLSLIGLAVGALLLTYYVDKVPALIQNGVENRVFYILLIPWGLSAAAFLFGAMRSYAHVTHKRLGTAFELGGPAAFFFIVVVVGYSLVQNAARPFDVTVRAGSADKSVPLIKTGKVTLELGNALRTEDIGSNGEANFKGIPSDFKGKTVRVLPQVDGYMSEWETHNLSDEALNLVLQRATSPGVRFVGSIVPPPKNWKGITIRVDGTPGLNARVDDLGSFDFPLSGKEGDRIRLKIYDDTNLVYDDYQTLPGPVTLKLHHAIHSEAGPSLPKQPQTSAKQASPFDGTWQVRISGDISNARVRSGTFEIAVQDDGSVLITANYRSDNMDISCRGNGSIAGTDLFVEYTATNSAGGSWSGKGKLHLSDPSVLSGQWDSKAGDAFPVTLRKLG